MIAKKKKSPSSSSFRVFFFLCGRQLRQVDEVCLQYKMIYDKKQVSQVIKAVRFTL